MDWDRFGRLSAYGGALALGSWFVFLIRSGLACWFDGDDIMNLHHYWSWQWAGLLQANLFFWSSYYRPGGGLFYKSIDALWGFHPLPFRIATLALLCVDFWLLGVVVREVTGSRWAALLALLTVGINPGFSAAYFDTGSIYDVLAYAFYWGAFALYLRWRQSAALLTAGGLTLLLSLFVLALDCKEISVTLPVAVALYELIWHPPADWNVAGLWRWIRREGRFALIAAVFDIAYIAGKRYGPGSLWGFEAYRPSYAAPAYLESLSHYLQELIYQPIKISPWQTATLLAAMAAVAAFTRRRCLAWGLGFILTGVLPLAFIPGRGGFAYFVPSVGWAVYFAGLADWLIEALMGARARFRPGVQTALLILLFGVLAPWQRKWIGMHEEAAQQAEERLRQRFERYAQQIHELMPAPRRGARILLLSDADGRDDFGIYMLIRLTYNDRSLEPERMTVWKNNHTRVDASGYDYVLDWVDGRFVLVSHK